MLTLPRKALELGQFCIEESGRNIPGVRIEPENNRAIATDGHLMGILDFKADPQEGDPVNLRGKDLTAALKAFKGAPALEVNTAEGVIEDPVGGGSLPCEVGAFRFPDYKTVIPKEGETPHRIGVDARKLARILDYFIKGHKKSYGGVGVSIAFGDKDHGILLKGSDPDGNRITFVLMPYKI